MAKARKEKKPIMSDDEERYMAFTGLVQWTAAVIEQHRRMGEANAAMRPVPRDPNVRWVAMSKPQVECHFSRSRLTRSSNTKIGCSALGSARTSTSPKSTHFRCAISETFAICASIKRTILVEKASLPIGGVLRCPNILPTQAPSLAR